MNNSSEAVKRTIRPSAKGLVIRDGKMLVNVMYDEDGKFYLMPGGGQEPGESLTEAVRREIAEEAGLWVKPIDLAFVIEGLNGEDFHRIDLVFRCEYERPMEDGEIERQEDINQNGIEWIPVESIKQAPLYPSKLRKPIYDLFHESNPKVYLGNEEMGDPVEVE